MSDNNNIFSKLRQNQALIDEAAQRNLQRANQEAVASAEKPRTQQTASQAQSNPSGSLAEAFQRHLDERASQPKMSEERQQMNYELAQDDADLLNNHPTTSAQAQEVDNLSDEQFAQFYDLKKQGVRTDDALSYVKTGKPVERETTVKDMAYGVARGAYNAGGKAVADIMAVSPRIIEAAVGKDNLNKTFLGDYLKRLNEESDKIAQKLSANRNASQGYSIELSKDGSTSVANNGGTVSNVILGTAEMAPDLAILGMTGGAAYPIIGIKGTSSSLHDYELTEKEDNDLKDLAASVMKGTIEGTLFKYSPKAGGYVTGKLSPMLVRSFDNMCAKYGTSATTKFLANKFATALSQDAGGIASGASLMIPQTTFDTLLDLSKDKIQGTNAHDANLWHNIGQATLDAFSFHVGGKAMNIIKHPIESVRSPFRVAGEAMTFNDSKNHLIQSLKDHNCTYNSSKNNSDYSNGDVVKMGKYGDNDVFIREDDGDTAKIVDAKTFIPREVPKSEVKVSNAGVRKLDSYASSLLGEYLTPSVPYVSYGRDKDGSMKLFTINTNGERGIAKAITKEDDGKLGFVYDEDGHRQLAVYDYASDSMMPVEEYTYRRSLNKSSDFPELEGYVDMANDAKFAQIGDKVYLIPQDTYTTDGKINAKRIVFANEEPVFADERINLSDVENDVQNTDFNRGIDSLRELAKKAPDVDTNKVVDGQNSTLEVTTTKTVIPAKTATTVEGSVESQLEGFINEDNTVSSSVIEDRDGNEVEVFLPKDFSIGPNWDGTLQVKKIVYDENENPSIVSDVIENLDKDDIENLYNNNSHYTLDDIKSQLKQENSEEGKGEEGSDSEEDLEDDSSAEEGTGDGSNNGGGKPEVRPLVDEELNPDLSQFDTTDSKTSAIKFADAIVKSTGANTSSGVKILADTIKSKIGELSNKDFKTKLALDAIRTELEERSKALALKEKEEEKALRNKSVQQQKKNMVSDVLNGLRELINKKPTKEQNAINDRLAKVERTINTIIERGGNGFDVAIEYLKNVREGADTVSMVDTLVTLTNILRDKNRGRISVPVIRGIGGGRKPNAGNSDKGNSENSGNSEENSGSGESEGKGPEENTGSAEGNADNSEEPVSLVSEYSTRIADIESNTELTDAQKAEEMQKVIDEFNNKSVSDSTENQEANYNFSSEVSEKIEALKKNNEAPENNEGSDNSESEEGPSDNSGNTVNEGEGSESTPKLQLTAHDEAAHRYVSDKLYNALKYNTNKAKLRHLNELLDEINNGKFSKATPDYIDELKERVEYQIHKIESGFRSVDEPNSVRAIPFDVENGNLRTDLYSLESSLRGREGESYHTLIEEIKENYASIREKYKYENLDREERLYLQKHLDNASERIAELEKLDKESQKKMKPIADKIPEVNKILSESEGDNYVDPFYPEGGSSRISDISYDAETGILTYKDSSVGDRKIEIADDSELLDSMLEGFRNGNRMKKELDGKKPTPPDNNGGGSSNSEEKNSTPVETKKIGRIISNKYPELATEDKAYWEDSSHNPRFKSATEESFEDAIYLAFYGDVEGAKKALRDSLGSSDYNAITSGKLIDGYKEKSQQYFDALEAGKGKHNSESTEVSGKKFDASNYEVPEGIVKQFESAMTNSDIKIRRSLIQRLKDKILDSGNKDYKDMSKEEREFCVEYINKSIKRINKNQCPPQDPTKIKVYDADNKFSASATKKALEGQREDFINEGYDVNKPFVDAKGNVGKSYNEVINELEEFAKNEESNKAERKEKIEAYCKNNGAEDKVNSSDPTSEKLKKFVPRTDSTIWKKLIARFKGIETKYVKPEEFKEFVDNVFKLYNSKKNNIEEAVCGVAIDLKTGMAKIKYSKAIEVLEELGWYDSKKAKVVSDAVKVTIRKKTPTDAIFDNSSETPNANVDSVKHPISIEGVNKIKKAFEGTGLFKNVEFLSSDSILKRYGNEAGKDAEDAIRDANGKLLGFLSKGGTIFLNKEALDADTTVHEIAHSLIRAYERTGSIPESFWEKAQALADASGALGELPEVYKNLPVKEQVEEALVRAIGREGGIQLEGSLWERFKDMANHKWLEIKSLFGVTDAKKELKWQNIVDEYAEKIVDVNFTSEEKDKFNSLDSNFSDVLKNLSEGNYTKADVEEGEQPKESWFSTDSRYARMSKKHLEGKFNKLVSPLKKADSTDNSLSARAWKLVNRYLFDSCEPMVRQMLTLHNKGIYITDKADISEAATVSTARGRIEAMTLLKDYVEPIVKCMDELEHNGKTIEDLWTGEETSFTRKVVGDILACLNAEKRNARTREENIQADRKKRMGAVNKEIKDKSRVALLRIKESKSGLKSLDRVFDKWEENLSHCTTEEERKKVSEDYVKYVSKEIFETYGSKIESAIEFVNNLHRYLDTKAKSDFNDKKKKGEVEGDYKTPAEFAHIPSLGLHKLKNMTIEELRAKRKEIHKVVEGACSEAHYRKIEGKIEEEEKKLDEEYKADAKKLEPTEWLREWEKNHPDLEPVYKSFEADYKADLASGKIQKFASDGTGISTKRAKAFLEKVTEAIGENKVKELSELVLKLNQKTLDNTFEGGFMDEKQYQSLTKRNEEEHYVPLRDFEYNVGEANNDYGEVTRSIFGGSGSSVLTKAHGRISRYGDIFKNMCDLAMSSIYAKHENRDKQNYFNFMQDLVMKGHNLQDIVRLGQWYVRDKGSKRWDSLEGEIPPEKIEPNDKGILEFDGKEYYYKSISNSQFGADYNLPANMARANAVNIFFEGRKRTLYLPNLEEANAMNSIYKKMASAETSTVLRALQGTTSSISKWLTTYNWAFALRNHQRDVQSYVIKLTGNGFTGVRESLASSYADVATLIYTNEINRTFTVKDKDGVEHTYNVKDLLDKGLSTGYVELSREDNVDSTQELLKDINEERKEGRKLNSLGQVTKEKVYNGTVAEEAYDKAGDFLYDKIGSKADALIEGVAGKNRKAIRRNISELTDEIERLLDKPNIKGVAIADAISPAKLNEFLELVPRLAATKVALKNGATLDEAIRFGKGITANFNRAGDLKYATIMGLHIGKFVYAGMPFFNASMQGIKMGTDIIQQQPKRFVAVMSMMFMAVFVQEQLYRWLFGKTSYGKSKYSTIDDYNRGSSFILPIGNTGKYMQFNNTHLFRGAGEMAVHVSDWLWGDKSTNQLKWGLVGAMADMSYLDFSMISQDEGGLRLMAGFAPAKVKAYADAYIFNRNFFGGKITGEPFDENSIEPEYQNVIGTYPEIYTDVARFFNNNIGGGSDFVRAGADYMEDGSYNPNFGDSNNDSPLNFNPQKLTYYLVQTRPYLKYGDEALKEYEKQKQGKSDGGVGKIILKSSQLDKVLYREIPDESGNAYAILSASKSAFNAVKGRAKELGITAKPNTKEYKRQIDSATGSGNAEEVKIAQIWNNINTLQGQAKQLRREMLDADVNYRNSETPANKQKLEMATEKYQDINSQLIAYLYNCKSYVYLPSTHKAITKWWSGLFGETKSDNDLEQIRNSVKKGSKLTQKKRKG